VTRLANHGTVRRCRTCKCQICGEVRREQSRKEAERRKLLVEPVKPQRVKNPTLDLGASLARIREYLDAREMQG
jgi:hypothetical protein